MSRFFMNRDRRRTHVVHQLAVRQFGGLGSIFMNVRLRVDSVESKGPCSIYQRKIRKYLIILSDFSKVFPLPPAFASVVFLAAVAPTAGWRVISLSDKQSR